MKFVIGLTLFAASIFGTVFAKQADHFNDQKVACMKVQGSGSVQYSNTGIPIGYECMRMHLVLKYKNGEYR